MIATLQRENKLLDILEIADPDIRKRDSLGDMSNVRMLFEEALAIYKNEGLLFVVDSSNTRKSLINMKDVYAAEQAALAFLPTTPQKDPLAVEVAVPVYRNAYPGFTPFEMHAKKKPDGTVSLQRHIGHRITKVLLKDGRVVTHAPRGK